MLEHIEIFSQAIEWFKKTKKEVNGVEGWGDRGADNRITAVNTAEAIMGLVFAGAEKHLIKNEIEQLKTNLLNSINRLEKGEKPVYYDFYGFPRQVCWPGIAMLIAGEEDWHILDKIADFLRKIKNNDGGWGYSLSKKSKKKVKNEKISNTFSTSLVLWFASLAGEKYDDLKKDAKKWLMKAFNKRGWGWHPKENENPAATAYALIALKEAGVGLSR